MSGQDDPLATMERARIALRDRIPRAAIPMFFTARDQLKPEPKRVLFGLLDQGTAVPAAVDRLYERMTGIPLPAQTENGLWCIKVSRDEKPLGFFTGHGFNRLRVHAIQYRSYQRAMDVRSSLSGDNPSITFVVEGF